MSKRCQVFGGVVRFAIVLVALLAPTTLRAEEAPKPESALSRWPVDLEHPEKGIPGEKDRNADPLQFGYWLQDVAARAERASKEGDHVTAAKLYEVLGLAVPERAVGFSKMCEEYEAAGDLARASNACGEALLRDGVRVIDYTRFVRLTLTKPGDLRDKDVAALSAVLDHMKEDPAGRDAVPDLECQVGVRTRNVAQLEECTAVLSAQAPEDPRTLTYEWALAVTERRFGDARELAARARSAGVPVANVAAMDRETTSGERRRRWGAILSVAGVAFFVGLVGFLGRGLLRRRPAVPKPDAAVTV